MTEPRWVIELIVVVALIDIALKGFAMWRAARLGRMAWFICIFVFNTAGILPIVYLIISDDDYKSKYKK